MKKKSNYTGRKTGSKNKKKKEPTKVIRVPLSKLEEIKKVIGK
jgi:hypothetical protein